MWVSKQTWLNLQSDLELAHARVADILAANEMVKKANDFYHADHEKDVLLLQQTTDALNAARSEAVKAQVAADAAVAELRAQVEALSKERNAAAAAKTTAEAEAKKLNITLDDLCHRFQLPRKGVYSDSELNTAAKRQRMRSQLGPEIGFILNEAKRRGMI